MKRNYAALLYILILLHVLVCLRLWSQKDRQLQAVKQVKRVRVNRAVVPSSVVKDYTLVIKHMLIDCISHESCDAGPAAVI